MQIHTPTLSVTSSVRPTDFVITLTFTPSDPQTLTEVDVAPAPEVGGARLMALLQEGIERLQVYRAGYMEEMEREARIGCER